MKILVVALGGLREAALATASLRALKKAHPAAKIGFLVDKSTETLFEDQSMIDFLHGLDASPKTFAQKLDELKRVVQDVRAISYDQAFVLGFQPLARWIPFMARIPERFGHRKGLTHFLLTKAVSLKGYIRRALTDLQNLIEESTGETYSEEIFRPRIESSIYEKNWADNWVKKISWQGKSIVVVVPYFGAESNSWDALVWFKLLRSMMSKKSNNRFVLLSPSVHHYQINQELSVASQESWRVLTLPNGLMKGMISRASLFIGYDPGLAQLSLSMGKPTICISDSALADRFVPIGHAEAKALLKSSTEQSVEEIINQMLQDKSFIHG